MARLTPRDIQEKEFTSGFRGYKEQEVDEFLDRITASYEEAFKENIDLKEEVERLHEENKKYELIGERMQAALVAAQETADDVRKNATKEAENILREAEIKAHKLVQASRDQHRELQKSLAVVKQVEEEFRFKLKSTLQSYLKLLDEIALGDSKEIKKWILPEDMSVLDERRRDMEGRENAEVAASPTDQAPHNDVKAQEKPKIEEPIVVAQKVEEQKVEEPKAETPKGEDAKAKEDAEAKAKALLEEIVQQAADEAKAAETTMAGEKKADIASGEVASGEVASSATRSTSSGQEDQPSRNDASTRNDGTTRLEEPKAAAPKADTKVEEAKVEEPKAKKPEEPKTEAKQAGPFDEDGAKGSAVTAEWETLQAAVAEAVKETDKPKGEVASSPTRSKSSGQASSEQEAQAPRNDAKATEAKETKPGKVNLDDIEIVEDESFWKDI